jgi:hypothetical protein
MARLGLFYRPGTPGASGGKNYLKGMDAIMANLNMEIELIKNGTMQGLVEVADHVRQKTNDAGKASDLTPQDKGNLNASWFVVTPTSTPATRGPHKFSSDPVGVKVQGAHAGTVAQARGEVASMSSANKKFLMMGYSAPYAGFVHEFIDPAINWTRIGSNAKWLQNTIYNEKGKILQIIAKNAKIK